MSSISILGGDWEILFDDEKNQNGGTNAVAGMRTIQHTGASETVYTTNQLYSAVADAADEFVAMGFRNPMLPVTPNAYTMENQYFIPRSSTQYLKEGAITADWSLGTVAGDGVLKVAYSGGTNFIATDIGRQVTKVGGTDAGDTGTLLDFDIDQDGTTVAWIRPDDPATDLFDDGTTGSISVVADGTGTGNANVSAAAVSGEHVFSAIQAIGSVPTATEVYLIQDRQKVSSWDDTFQWWATDADASLGIISILIQVKDSDTLIADGDVEVFARRYTALYDNFRLNVAGGGFSALPLASAPDINNTTGYRSLDVTGATASVWTVGDGIFSTTGGGSTWADAASKGVITNVINPTTTTPTIEYYLVGDLTDFSNADVLQEYDFSAAANGTGDGSVNGAPSNTSGGPTDSAAGEGGTVTITLDHTDVDHDGNGTPEPYSISVDCQSNVPIAKVYERIKYVTRRGQDNSFWDTNSSNMPGETYRGLDTFVEFDGAVGGAMTDGEDVTGQNGYTARLAGYSTSVAWASPADYITLSDSQTSLDSVIDNDTISGVSSGNTVEARTVAGGGSYGIITFTSPKASPFGTFTGSQIFGARGVAFINPASADVQAYILTDDIGTLNTPPNTVSFTVSNTAALDRILVARDTGTSGIIDKDQFGGMTAATQGDTTLTVATTPLNEQVPPVGYIRVVDTDPALSRLGNTDTQQEHKYEYSSVNLSTGVFTLAAMDDDGDVTTASTTQLIDTSADFTSPAVQVGMLVRNTTLGKESHVWEVTNVVSATTLDVSPIYGPGNATQDWDLNDTFQINQVITDYTTSDDVYDLILDVEASGTSVSNTFTKTLSSNFGVVVNVRQGKVILPFTLNQTQGDGSTTVTVVRQPDNIAT
jgi:hypothetical protein